MSTKKQKAPKSKETAIQITLDSVKKRGNSMQELLK